MHGSGRCFVRVSTFWVSALLASAVVLTLSNPLLAQTVTGTLQGTVTDTHGGALPGAGISIRNTETGLERFLTTNSKGFYRETFLPIGVYRVTASLPGFGTVVREKVEVPLNSTVVTDFKLDPRVTEEVRVSAEQPHINTTNAEIKGSLTAEQIEAKPNLNPGSFLSLAETFPGFQENPTSGQNNPTLSSGSSINFSGTGTRGATFQINGVNNDDSSENQNRQGVALSTIKEFQIITDTFSAEFGRGYGAVVLVQTKSGTNDIHGDAYFYRQQSSWNEKSYFARNQPKPVNRRNEYGATAGFPLLQDRLFGYLAFDQTRRDGELSYARDIFLQSELAAPRLTRGNDTPANRAFINSVLGRFPSNAVPNDPRSNRTYATVINFDQPDDDYSGRLDWEAAVAHHLTARYQFTHQIRDADDVIIGEQAKQNNRQRNLGVTYTHLFSPTAAGEFRYGLGLRSTNVDIKAGNDTPVIRFAGSPSALASIIGNAGAFPINRDQTDNQFVYNFSALLGNNHSMKAGTDIRLQKLDDRADNFTRGFYSFNRVCGGTTYASSWAAFLDGCVATYTIAYGPAFLENRINEYNFYLEDNWQIRPNLTLDLGARYEYVEAPREVKNRINYGYSADKNNLEPRVAFAFSPAWNSGVGLWLTGGPGNASIRGGYGHYHGRIFQSIFSQGGASVRFNPPNALLTSFTTLPNILNLSDPTLGFVFVPGPQTTRHSETLIDPNLQVPYTRQWSLSFERKMLSSSTLRVSYTGNRGVGLLRYTLDNLPVPPEKGGAYRYAADFQCAGTGMPNLPVNATCPVPVPIASDEVSLRVPRVNERRSDPRFTTNLVISNGASSHYHGLQFDWETRLGSELQFQVSYTWSKAIDDVSEATDVGAGDSNQGPADEEFRRGLSRFDTRHRLTLNGSYLLPIFRQREDLLGTLLGGWQLAAVLKIASGTPFTVTDSAWNTFYGFAWRPVLVDSSVNGRTIDNPNTSQQQLPAGAFRRRTPADSNADLVGRNTFFTDGVLNLDLGIYKAFALPWHHQFIVRAEVYNVFNRTQFGIPVTDFNATNFGAITGTLNSPRTFQLAGRYVF